MNLEKEFYDILCGQLDRLYRFAYNRTRDAYLAEDLTQDIVLSAIRSYRKIKNNDLIIPWIWGVARNVYMRSAKPPCEYSADESFIIDSIGINYETPENMYIANEDIINIRRSVSYLAKIYRDVAVMFYIEENDYSTISQKLSIPISSVKWRLNQSKNQLREGFEKMNYMGSAYRKAQDLFLCSGGWCAKPHLGERYAGAEKSLETLLAKNIAIIAYEKPVTVTEISAALGTAADYVEDIIGKMVKSQTIEKSSNKYQTNFPIFTEEQLIDMYDGNLKFAAEKADEIFNMLCSLKHLIQNLSFYGSQKDFESLLLMLITIIGKETTGNISNIFDVDDLPFKGIDESWFIYGTTVNHPGIRAGTNGGGLSWNTVRSLNNSTEYNIYSPLFKNKFNDKAMNVLYQLFYSDIYFGHDTNFIKEETPNIALLIEEGKIMKNGDKYIIKIPIFDESKSEYQKLVEVLSPVIDFTSKLQKTINSRSLETVRKYIPKRLNCDKFYGIYTSNFMIESAFFDILHEKNLPVTADMLSWCTFKKNI